MSNYEDCFSFCVENGQRLLELKIVCSQRPPQFAPKYIRWAIMTTGYTGT